MIKLQSYKFLQKFNSENEKDSSFISKFYKNEASTNKCNYTMTFLRKTPQFSIKNRKKWVKIDQDTSLQSLQKTQLEFRVAET